MKPIIKETIDQLNSWRDAYLADFEDDGFGPRECEDLLDNIRVGEHKCYASHLFNQLSDDDKEQVQGALDFIVDFDGLASYYHVDAGDMKGGAK